MKEIFKRESEKKNNFKNTRINIEKTKNKNLVKDNYANKNINSITWSEDGLEISSSLKSNKNKSKSNYANTKLSRNTGIKFVPSDNRTKTNR